MLPPDHAFGLCRSTPMYTYDVGSAKDVFEGYAFGKIGFRMECPANDLHAYSHTQFSDFTADRAGSDQSQCFPAKLSEQGPWPFPFPNLRIDTHGLFRNRHAQGQR